MHAAHKYARDVVAGKINVCEYVRLACQRHLDDLKRKDWNYVFDEGRADHVINFLRHLKHYKGPYAGKLFEPLPWQQFFVGSVYGWVDKHTGLRRFRRAYLEVPRKNGKTFLCGGLGLYGLFADQEAGSEVYIAATSKDQASLAYKDARALYGACDDLHELGKPSFYDITFPARNGIMKALSSESKRLDGLNPHLAIFDELHAWEPVKGEALWDVFADGMGARDQPLILSITTAGFNQLGVCWTQREHLINVLKRKEGFEDEKLFGLIYTIDEGDDWENDQSVWFKANPNLGQGKKVEFVADQVHEAQQVPSRENAVKNKQFDLWTKAAEKWLDVERWDNCRAASWSLKKLHGERCIVGLDLSSTTDLTACIYLFPTKRGRNKMAIYPRFFIPEDTAATRSKREKIPYERWAKAGWIQTTPGNSVDYDFVRKDIEDHKRLFDIKEIGIDPWNMAGIAPGLIDDGFEVIQVRQGFASLSAPSKELEKLILKEAIQHDGNPVLSWCVENAAVDRDPAENIKPTKGHSSYNRIDGVSGIVTGLARVLEAQDKPSVYESRGIRTIR